MANSFVYPLFFLLFLLPLPSLSETSGSVSVGESIAASDKASPWLSPLADFAFGFKQLQDEKQFVLSIWFNKIPDKTIVWYANNGVPVLEGSKVEVSSEKGLVLTDPQGKELWKSELALSEVGNGFLNDTGNFVLLSKDSVSLWESFKNPTDTMLPTQVMDFGGLLFSRHTEANFSRGRFVFRLLHDGNLVLNTRDVATGFNYDAYYISNTYASGYQVRFNTSGYMYILTKDNQRKALTLQDTPYPPSRYYHRATLDFDGVFSQYVHPKDFQENVRWTSIWTEPENICSGINGYSGGGACGYNNICSLNGNRRPDCNCPTGFSLLDPDDKHGACGPNITNSCEDDHPSSAEDLYDMVELLNVDWPGWGYAGGMTQSEEDCKNSCLHDCLCAVVIIKDGYCLKKALPLSNGRTPENSSKAFLKIKKRDIPRGNPPASIPEKEGPLSPGLVALLCSSLVVNLVLTGTTCLGLFLIYRKKTNRKRNTAESKLRFYTYKELLEATCGFKEELGRGSFGIVYKGVTHEESARTLIAVKRLDRVVQRTEKEFRTEVNVIGQTHHRNLVRLLGFCDEEQHRMLVYELLSNGALSSYLFGDMKPSWKQRTQIAIGVARGLLYLHEECSSQIIHCDIKPQNILLDDCYNARISDFGLAKHLMTDHSKTSIASIRGTKGYVAPEWFNTNTITVKVDLYSFGVLLLETIFCRRNVSHDWEIGGEEKVILTEWVCDCFRERKLHALVENDLEALNDWKRVERFVMIAIWCIQEDPSLRPTMREVTNMLEGVIQVTVPPYPSPSFASGYA